MAFKSVSEFNEERYHGKFRLVNNKDEADVIFLYRSKADELQVDAHYINSATYSGYVHCCGTGCPACAKGLRVQNKLFVPMYIIRQNSDIIGKIEFWDRPVAFYKQLDQDVFNKAANPSEYIFNIKRNGESGDRDTRYTITPTNNNNVGSYDEILAKFNAKMPDYYSEVIRDIPAHELAEMLQSGNGNTQSGSLNLPDYTPIPRAGYQPSIPDTFVDAAEAINPSAEIPESDDAMLESSDEGNEEIPDPEF